MHAQANSPLDTPRRARSPRPRSRGVPERRSNRQRPRTSPACVVTYAGRKIKDRKHHIITDTGGHLVGLRVHTAAVAGSGRVVQRDLPRLEGLAEGAKSCVLARRRSAKSASFSLVSSYYEECDPNCNVDRPQSPITSPSSDGSTKGSFNPDAVDPTADVGSAAAAMAGAASIVHLAAKAHLSATASYCGSV